MSEDRRRLQARLEAFKMAWQKDPYIPEELKKTHLHALQIILEELVDAVVPPPIMVQQGVPFGQG